MNRKKIIGLLLFSVFFLVIISPAFSQEELDDSSWEKGRLTAVGKDFIKVDGVSYHVSPDVVITGLHGNSLGSDLKKLREADEIMFRLLKETEDEDIEDIIEIRILRLTS